MKGRLWQCDPTWKRLHSQRVEFSEWPQVGKRFGFFDALKEPHDISSIQVVDHGAEMARFETTNARFELEKLP